MAEPRAVINVVRSEHRADEFLKTGAAVGGPAEGEEAVEARRSRDGMLRELRRDQENGTERDPLAEVAARFDW